MSRPVKIGSSPAVGAAPQTMGGDPIVTLLIFISSLYDVGSCRGLAPEFVATPVMTSESTLFVPEPRLTDSSLQLQYLQQDQLRPSGPIAYTLSTYPA
jgi:hypothetical protein